MCMISREKSGEVQHERNLEIPLTFSNTDLVNFAGGKKKKDRGVVTTEMGFQ